MRDSTAQMRLLITISTMNKVCQLIFCVSFHLLYAIYIHVFFLIKKLPYTNSNQKKSYSVLFFPLIFNMNMFCMSPSPINLYGLLSFYSILCWRYVLFDPQISLVTLGDIVIN